MGIFKQVAIVVRRALAAQSRSRSQRLALAELIAFNPARLDELGIDLITVQEAMRQPRPDPTQKRSTGRRHGKGTCARGSYVGASRPA